ncbi:hypothetical protein J2I47_24100 [Fibrella sp. HMF5335]|uniref:Uncharacterized protein n=1 Tax=Fibrella rubiginis TaxID=2817060 RepID=A0A939K779_9BACT|nr:hypothetical protein [Fibrella rubiginis]MBO0939653.1 hypothetical protein [Fibrella rubiginis]
MFDRQPVRSAITAMTFEEYLATKKIDAVRFAAEDPVIFDEWSRLFDQVSVESFTVQKKFLLNLTRRKYLMR